MFTRTRCLLALGIGTLAVTFVIAAVEAPVTASAAMQQPAAAANAEGFAITNADVRAACSACHVPDAQDRMSRISYRRATPENWELTIKRMIALNGATFTLEQARGALKYLADNQGLAPEEARPVMFDADKRMVDFTYTANADTHGLCNQCHSMGRVLSERRTPEEWSLLISMHRGVYPGIDGGSGGFRRGAGGGRAGTAAAGRGRARLPMDLAVEHLQGAFPLRSPEWTAWSAAKSQMRLAGKWIVSGYEAGKGKIYGEVTMTEQAGVADTFTTTTVLTYALTGQTVTRTGKGVVYTGFQWRGRGEEKGATDPWREVSFVERDQNVITGRWFTGAYAERGMDVTLRRVGRDPMVGGTDVASLKTGATGQTVKIYGANLPLKLTTADVAFGEGVTVTRVVTSTATVATVTVDVASTARVGPRDLAVAGSVRPTTLVVYDRVDGVKVLPRAGMARLGGVVHPKQFQQFEAIAFNNGPDRLPGTTDDLDLGLVDAKWKLEEYSATFKEDDMDYVGSLSPTGFFTPALEGPNPERSGNRNNMGDVWAVAEYTPSGGATLRGRAHLLVTVPLYMNWDSTEVAR